VVPAVGAGGARGVRGLFLVTGRAREGRALLLSVASKLDRGLLPSEFPETGGAPSYHGADVSLWFANAVAAYLRYTDDEATVAGHLLAPLLQVVEHYRRGTRLGISADETGLLKTHAPASATTWMDAKVGDWVITPRQGRPVEVNALWHNAVCVAADLAARVGRTSTADDLSALARLVRVGFNERFWNAAAGCCYDVVGDRAPDAAVRPNQLLAMSLPYPVLSADRHPAVLDRVLRDLRTPLGVRTLSPHDPLYCGRCAGNVTVRDRAAHNGSAYPWLLGPLVTAYVRVHGRGEAPAGRPANCCEAASPTSAATASASCPSCSTATRPTPPAARSRRPCRWPRCCARTTRTCSTARRRVPWARPRLGRAFPRSPPPVPHCRASARSPADVLRRAPGQGGRVRRARAAPDAGDQHPSQDVSLGAMRGGAALVSRAALGPGEWANKVEAAWVTVRSAAREPLASRKPASHNVLPHV
jgi:hypothetical protein